MNKTIITKRSYNPLIDFSIFVLIFLFIRMYFVNTINALNLKIDLIYDKRKYDIATETFSEDVSKIVAPIYDKIEYLSIQFGLLVIISAFVIFYNLSRYFNHVKHKFVLLLVEVILVSIIFSNTSTDMKINADDDDNFISLLIFIPFLFFIYHNTLIGKKVDITKQVKDKEETAHNDDINDLNKLFELNLISKEEYDKKKEFRLKEKIREEIKETEEYNLLLKSKQKSLLTEDEFNKKVENLVNIKYNKKECI